MVYYNIVSSCGKACGFTPEHIIFVITESWQGKNAGFAGLFDGFD
jgi:hypothetical protein